MVSSPLRGSKRPQKTMFWWSPMSSATGSAAGEKWLVSIPFGITS